MDWRNLAASYCSLQYGATFKAMSSAIVPPYETSTNRPLPKTSGDETTMVCSPSPFVTAGSLMYLSVKDAKHYQGIHGRTRILCLTSIGKLVLSMTLCVSPSLACSRSNGFRFAYEASQGEKVFQRSRIMHTATPQRPSFRFVSTMTSSDTYRQYTRHQTINKVGSSHPALRWNL